MSMFSFQAIHNLRVNIRLWWGCLSIMSMFSFQAIHNVVTPASISAKVVYRLCQCSLFKQFTTRCGRCALCRSLFIDYVNVLFSSNSQHQWRVPTASRCCLSIMSMFSFQAIHNEGWYRHGPRHVVYRLCQCSLFKQLGGFGIDWIIWVLLGEGWVSL